MNDTSDMLPTDEAIETAARLLRTIARDWHALYVMHKAIEDTLIELRDHRESAYAAGNGFVIVEADGNPSEIIRLRVPEGISIGLRALADHIESSAAPGNQEEAPKTTPKENQ
jgi:hypothetical protein